MELHKKIEALNSLEVVRFEATEHELKHVFTHNNETTKQVLKDLVPDVEAYISSYGNNEVVDLTVAAFHYVQSDYWHPDKGFTLFSKEELLGFLEQKEHENRVLAQKNHELETKLAQIQSILSSKE